MKKREKVTIGHLWGAFYPALLYYVLTTVVSIIFIAIAINQGHLQVQDKNDLTRFIQEYSLLMTFLAALIMTPVLILIKHRDMKMQRAIGAYGYKSEFFLKYLLIIPFSITFMYAANMFVSILEKLIPSIAHSFDDTAQAIYGANIYIQILTAIILGPIVEELIFRGLMYIRLKRMFGVGVASVVTGIMFGLIHGNVSQGIYAFLFSFAAIFVYEKFKNIAAPIIFHMAANAISVLVSLAFNDYNKSSETVNTQASGSVDITVQIGVFIFMAALCFLFGFIIKRCVNPTSK